MAMSMRMHEIVVAAVSAHIRNVQRGEPKVAPELLTLHREIADLEERAVRGDLLDKLEAYMKQNPELRFDWDGRRFGISTRFDLPTIYAPTLALAIAALPASEPEGKNG